MRPFNNLSLEEIPTGDSNYGKFVLTPLERGFGITIGNALRRVLISSIPGASIFAVKIEGAEHEFTALDGVVEDVTAIILNLKDLVIAIDSPRDDDVCVLTIDQDAANGPKTVYAKDIVCPSEVRVINPDLVICHLAQGGKLKMTIQANKGRGYFTSEVNKRETNAPVGTIPTDSNYSPVVKVNFAYEPTRVEQDTNYDKLTLEVWTNGALSPREAVGIAAHILIEHLKVFIADGAADASDSTGNGIFPPPSNNTKNDLVNDKQIEDLDLSVRSYNCLKRAGISTVGELVSKTEEEMMKVRNLGKKSLKEVKDKLAEMNLHFLNGK
jgi:DNA-directed RNA polymerase subunit alpha